MAKNNTDPITAVVAPGTVPENLIISQIVIRPPVRKTSDVSTWRTALQAADYGRMKLLYDLYEDLLIDGVMSDAVSKRIDAITNSQLTFQNAAGEEVQEIVDLIDSPAWEDVLTTIMQARFWGRSGMEFDFTDGLKVWQIPFKNISLINKQILLFEADTTGVSYTDDDHILVIGKERDYGLLLKTAPYCIWKRGGFGDYAQWLEIFGMPQRVGKYSSYDPESKKLLEQALENAGAAPWIVVPKEADIETTQSNGSNNSGKAYDEFRKACNEEMLITILGQTLTTVQGDKGARSLGEVHKDVEEGKHRSDMRFVQRALNYYLLPVLEKRGFPVKGGKFVFPDDVAELTVDEMVSLSSIMDIPSAYLHEKYSIPIPKDGEPTAKNPTPPAPIIADPNNPVDPNAITPPEPAKPSKKKPEVKLSDDQRGFLKSLVSFFAVARTTRSRASLTLDDKSTNFTAGINIDKLFNQALNDIYKQYGINPDDMPIISKPLYDISNTSYQQAIDSEFGKMGVEFGKTYQPFIDEFKTNASVFSAFKNHQQTNDIVSLLTNKNGDLRSFDEFRKLANNVSRDYNQTWLKTEYTQAVRSARMAAKVKSFMETADLYPNMEYLETTAATPREEHASWVGTILPITDPWWDTHMPPSAWGCECSVRNTDADIVEPPEDDTLTINPLFANNPAKTAEIVNMAEHPYVKNCDAEIRKEIVIIAKDWVQSDVSKKAIKQLREYAKQNIVGTEVAHDKLEKVINFTNTGIKEFLNQPHKYYENKNDLIKDIHSVIKNSEYKGKTDYHKNNKGILYSHIFEIKLNGEKSWIIARESTNGDINFYSISDNKKVLGGVKIK